MVRPRCCAARVWFPSLRWSAWRDEAPLQIGHESLEIKCPARQLEEFANRGRRLVEHHSLGESIELDLIRGLEGNGALDRILELANVAGPAVGLQAPESLARDAEDSSCRSSLRAA